MQMMRRGLRIEDPSREERGGGEGENRKNYSNDESNQHREIFQSAFPKSQVRVYTIEQ